MPKSILKKTVAVVLLFIGSYSTLLAQEFNELPNVYRLDTFNYKRARGVVALETGLSVGSSIGLYKAWYSGYEQSGFHWIDDSYGWLQIDKYGHAATAYHLVQFCYNMNRWSGMSKNKSMLIGGGIAYGFQTAIEFFDGLSEAWGASWTDAAMNTLGAATFISQEYLWGEQRIIWKYSFHPGNYSNYDINVQNRATALYSDIIFQQWLKDYNGQSYWLSINPASFMNGNSRMPEWLNIAVGYSAEGLFGANWNVWLADQCYYDYSHIPRYRQYLFSLDVDFTKLPIKAKWFRYMAPYLNIIKVPFPTLEINELGKVKGYWMYF
ncbi:MAG: DUF2279 domain-containing protein [Bacteroidetes bacterium]|nr:DUF2279 domain-containing protein [Bacteroidota bacterium]